MKSPMQLSIRELMARSGVKFGTSGARGLVGDMTDLVCYAYTQGFLQYLESTGELAEKATPVAVAGDLRPSTSRIMTAVLSAVQDLGCVPLNCGTIPSPALALYGFERRIPSIMVTGSHIPAERNGIKFNKPAGEVLKEDEAGIAGQVVELKEELFDGAGHFRQADGRTWPARPEARAEYAARYTRCFEPASLHGLRLGVYQHSAVSRELLVEILTALGAETVPLGFSDEFLPVDTEAIRPEDERLATRWAAEHSFDAIVSTDGDSDRPLLSDEQGRWLRGDITGILCAKFLAADSVSTPVSSNTAVEKCGWFKEVRRTRIGSPFVIASMMQATAAGARRVVGYEANGGFLLNSDFALGGSLLRALPTRDAVILLVGVLRMARQEGKTVSQLAAQLPRRFTSSGLIRGVPPERSRAILDRFRTGRPADDQRTVEAVFGGELGSMVSLDWTDGLRLTFGSGEILHLRPSGNAPEFRLYSEAASEARASRINEFGREIVLGLPGTPTV
jgi:phosphomannomutase